MPIYWTYAQDDVKCFVKVHRRTKNKMYICNGTHMVYALWMAVHMYLLKETKLKLQCQPDVKLKSQTHIRFNPMIEFIVIFIYLLFCLFGHPIFVLHWFLTFSHQTHGLQIPLSKYCKNLQTKYNWNAVSKKTLPPANQILRATTNTRIKRRDRLNQWNGKNPFSDIHCVLEYGYIHYYISRRNSILWCGRLKRKIGAILTLEKNEAIIFMMLWAFFHLSEHIIETNGTFEFLDVNDYYIQCATDILP